MKVISAAVAALVLAAAGSAHAAIVVDVDNLVLPPAGTGVSLVDVALLASPGNPALGAFPNDTQFFQTWTPTVQGQLATLDLVSTTGIKFGGQPPADFNFTLSIYSGDVRQGGAVKLGSLDFNSAPYTALFGVNTFDLSSLSISTSPGQIMTMGFSVDACDPTLVCGFAASMFFYDTFPGGTLLATSNGYAGGEEYSLRNGVLSPAPRLPSSNDLSFRISVDDGSVAGVPEPGAWVLMLTGLFGAGAVLRRRRCAANPASA